MSQFNLAGVKVGAGQPVRIMGVINVSPESFFKGSVHASRRAIAAAARRMADEGADFIDVGAMSTAPYLKTIISEQEEADRLSKAIDAIVNATNVPVSVDSFRTWPVLAGLKAGAKILNDITGLAANPELASVSRLFQGLILMAHPLRLSANGKPIPSITKILQQSLREAKTAGMAASKMAVDPGIGFFRNAGMPWWKWDLTVLRDLKKLKSLNAPLLVGVSRKSFIGEILRIKNPDGRLAGSLAATAAAVLNGAAIIRTHDVKETKEAVRMAEGLRED